jgi:monoamine oxidase
MDAISTLEILKNGLPKNDLPSRQIVVIGAGMAGLTAALLLQEAGHKVTILEAQNRLGGRVYTYHGFAGKMVGEFGAMRFP